MFRVVNNLRQAFDIGKEQVCTLVSGKTTAETNHQCVGVDAFEQRNNARRVALVFEPHLGKHLADKTNKLIFQRHARVPNLLVVYIVDAMPNLFVALVGHERRVEVLIVKLTPLGSGPSGQVNAIGYIAHVVFFGVIAFPNGGKHLLANPSVQATNAVNLLASVASEHRHTESFIVVIGVFAAHTDKFVPRNAQA